MIYNQPTDVYADGRKIGTCMGLEIVPGEVKEEEVLSFPVSYTLRFEGVVNESALDFMGLTPRGHGFTEVAPGRWVCKGRRGKALCLPYGPAFVCYAYPRGWRKWEYFQEVAMISTCQLAAMKWGAKKVCYKPKSRRWGK